MKGSFGFAAFGAVVIGAAIAGEVVVRPDHVPDRIRVTYWEKWTAFEGAAIRTLVDDFNRSQDRIYVDLLTVSNIGNKTLLAVAGGIPPDIAGLFGPNVAQFADDHALMPLDDFCREFGIKQEDYIPVYWNIGFYRNRIYALPSTPATTALHFNEDHFQLVGRRPKSPPKTIEELDEIAGSLSVRRPDGGFDRVGFMPAEPGWFNWGWGYFFGGKLWDGKTTLTPDSPENVRAFEWVQSYSKRFGAGDLQTFQSGFGSFSSPQNAFLDGKVSMVIQGVWMHNFVNMFNPEMQWSAAPFPHPADRPDLADVTFADMDVLVIPRGAKHPREAFEFIAWLQKQENMEKLCLLHRKNSPLAEVSDNFWAQHENPYIRLFDNLARSKNAVSPPKLGIWPEYAAEMNTAFDRINLLLDTPAEALGKVRRRMQPKLDQHIERSKLRIAREAQS